MQSGPPIVAEGDLEERAARRLGMRLLDKWRLDTVLGVGGMAAVYAATHRNGKQVAIKVLHPELAAYAEVKQRFLAEGYAANRVAHPGAVSVLDDGITEDGSNFLVMELLLGETLEARVSRCERLPALDVLEIGVRLLDVLAAAHDKGLVHRDVKPDNVFITLGGEVKLLDFGIASAVDGSRPRTTRAGTPMGTPSYMPPEQARARWELVDARADVWAAGATLYYALSGRNVHEADAPAEELLKAMTEQAPPLKSVAPLVPQIVAAAIDRALAFSREDRWRDARSMQAALREARALLSAPELELTPPAGTSTISLNPEVEPPSDTLSARPVAYTEPPPASRRAQRAAPAHGRTRLLAAVASLAVLAGAAVAGTAVLGNAGGAAASAPAHEVERPSLPARSASRSTVDEPSQSEVPIEASALPMDPGPASSSQGPSVTNPRRPLSTLGRARGGPVRPAPVPSAQPDRVPGVAAPAAAQADPLSRRK